MKVADSLYDNQPENQSATQRENQIDIRAEGQSQVNVVSNIISPAGPVHVGNRYEIPCPLPPPVAEHLAYTPDNRDLALWIDRVQFQETLQQHIKDARTVLVEIVAAGGFGKSSLAVWLSEQAEAKEKKVIWVSFSAASRFRAFARWVLYKLCVPTEDTMTEYFLMQQLVHHLREHPCLVVMDQLESIRKTVEKPFFEDFLAAWQEKGRKSKVLVTTRQRIIAQEQLCLQLLGFTNEEGSAFLQKHGITSSLPDGLSQLSEICSGHPLLLNLSATWLEKTENKLLTQEGLDFFDKLLKQDLSDPEAQVEEIFEILLDQLPVQLRLLLLESSVYRLPFNLKQAQAMQSDLTASDLVTLETQGFLLGQENQLRLHPLVNQLVTEVREAEGATTDAHRKAIEYFENQLQAEATNIQNYLECFHHYCEIRDYKTAYDTLNRCFYWLDLRGYYRTLVNMHERLITAWQASPPDDDEEKKKLGLTLNHLGTSYKSLGDYPKAIDLQQQALKIQRKIGNRQGEATSLFNLGDTYESLGDYPKAIDLQQQALKIQRKIGNRQGEAASLCKLGTAYESLGDYPKAIDLQQQALKIQRKIGNRQGEAVSLGSLGTMYRLQGKYRQAINFQQQSLEIKHKIGNRQGEAASLCKLGVVYQSLGEYRQAINLQQQALKIQREIGDRQGEATSLCNLGTAYHLIGKYRQAINFQQQSLELKHKIGDRKGKAASLDNLGTTYQLIGEDRQAIKFLQQALKIQREIGDRQGEAASLCNLAPAYRSRGEDRQAIKFLQQALKIQCEIGDRQGEAISLGNLGNTYELMGEYRQAINFQQQALKMKRRVNDRNGEAISLLNLGIAYAKIDEHWEAKEIFEQAQKLFTELKLPHLMEKCGKAIQERNRMIARIPKKAPPLPTKNTEPDWWEKSMPTVTPDKSPQSQSALSKWIPYIALAIVIFFIILILQ